MWPEGFRGNVSPQESLATRKGVTVGGGLHRRGPKLSQRRIAASNDARHGGTLVQHAIMQMLGIIGGIGPESTIAYYRLLMLDTARIHAQAAVDRLWRPSPDHK